MWGNAVIGIITGAMTLGVLIFSEIIPKNLGVVYRTQLHPWVVNSLVVLRILMAPVTYMANASIKLVVKGDIETDPDADEKEIILLAEKGAKEGSLTSDESDMVTNALKLDEVQVSEIMTPESSSPLWKSLLQLRKSSRRHHTYTLPDTRLRRRARQHRRYRSETRLAHANSRRQRRGETN